MSDASKALSQLNKAIEGDVRALDYGLLHDVLSSAVQREKSINVELTNAEADVINSALALYDAEMGDRTSDGIVSRQKAVRAFAKE